MTNVQGPNSNESIDLTGHRLDDYQLIRRLGRGGMADVYLADQKSLGRQVAIKALRPNLAVDEKYVQRFHREAKAAAGLNQQNIVQIYEVGESEGVHYIAQEYIRGQNLKQYLQRHSVVEPILAVNIIRQVAAALQTASTHGVIHRDIKPENIMLTPTGEVKVTDFGLARVKHEGQTDLTQVGITMGTPLYMSPEQVEGGSVDTRSDIYSLGVTAFQMLVGRPPFEGENPLTLAVQHVKKTPPPIAKLRPDLPTELCDLIHKMIAKKPNERVQTPAEIIKLIRKIDISDALDWDSLADRLQVGSDSLLGSAETLAVTQQLETVMTGHLPKWWRTPTAIVTTCILIIIGVLTGIFLANLGTDPTGFENIVMTPGGIEKQESVEAQYEYAYFLTSALNPNEAGSFDRAEEIWKSVRKFFPPSEATTPGELKSRQIFCWRSDERLGELYLRENKWDQAEVVYSRLIYETDEIEKRFQTVGFAGIAVVFTNQEKRTMATNYLYVIKPDLDLLNKFMRSEIELLQAFYFSEEEEEATSESWSQ